MPETTDKLDALRDLLGAAFDAEELRRFVGGGADGQRLRDALPGGTASEAEVVQGAVEVLDRHGRIDRDLFVRLQRARPGRAAEIAAVADRFDLRLPAPTQEVVDPAGSRRRPAGLALGLGVVVVGATLALLLWRWLPPRHGPVEPVPPTAPADRQAVALPPPSAGPTVDPPAAAVDHDLSDGVAETVDLTIRFESSGADTRVRLPLHKRCSLAAKRVFMDVFLAGVDPAHRDFFDKEGYAFCQPAECCDTPTLGSSGLDLADAMVVMTPLTTAVPLSATLPEGQIPAVGRVLWLDERRLSEVLQPHALDPEVAAELRRRIAQPATHLELPQPLPLGVSPSLPPWSPTRPDPTAAPPQPAPER